MPVYLTQHSLSIYPAILFLYSVLSPYAAMHNLRSLWPLGTNLIDCGTAYVAFGEPTRPKEGETVAELKRRIRNEMIELQKLCPLFDPEVKII